MKKQNCNHRQPLTPKQLKLRDQARALDWLNGTRKPNNYTQRTQNGEKLNSWRASVQYRGKKVQLGSFKSPQACTSVIGQAYQHILNDCFVPPIFARSQFV